jgi:hypothetical protein
MSKTAFYVAGALMAVAAGPAFGASTFQNSCSNITFAYSGNNAALQAVCLHTNGTPNPSTLLLQGIGNQNGNLVQGTGASTFQQSCGNIQIAVSGANVTLSALCRTSSGNSQPTSLPLNNINNNNGTLTQ